MVFSSINPVVYLDPPNWHHHHHHHQQQSGDAAENLQLPPLPLPLPPPGGGSGSSCDGGGGSSGGSIRPGSMSERARQAKIPQPETALKCPRCDSTNTKFCYFNNYSLTQPRHFCKTCRRYWTRGGALRNVPVGGGCRRNKRSKGSNRSKSPAAATSKATSSSSGVPISSSSDIIMGHNNNNMPLPPPPPPLSLQHMTILPPFHHLNDFNSAGIGLNYSGIHPSGSEFQIGSTNSGGSFLSDQLRFQQVQNFPNFLTNLETPSGFYSSYDGDEPQTYVGQLRSKPMDSVVTQFATVKMEENNRQQRLNLSKNFLGMNDQYWSSGNAAFSDLPAITSSSTTNLL